MASLQPAPTIRRARHLPEIALACLVIGVAALLVAPLPAVALDVLLAVNLGLAVVVLLVALSVRRPLSVSAFPAVLLITTLFRLGLNVSSTRLILGQAWAGDVIEAFASWVVAGSLVVGVVIFLILTVIQFVVIARGGERVAEVAARFALDAMPGRQMAIDSDLRAGAITRAQASRVRDRLQRESRLYGAMDGAMKFVKGDAVAGLFILAVDLLGGIAVGMIERNMGLGDALTRYGMLTIGDGLVTQIPALLIATAAALVVTRVASASEHGRAGLGADIAHQLGDHPRALATAAVFLLVLALLPGLPVLPFLVLACITGLAALAVHRRRLSTESEPRDGTSVDALPPRLAVELPTHSPLTDEAIRDVCREVTRRTGAPLPPPTIVRDGDSTELQLVLDGFPATAALPAEATAAQLERALLDVLPAVLSMQDVQRLLDALEQREPALVRSVTASSTGLYGLTRLMRELLAEGLPIAPLRGLLESQLELDEDASHAARLAAARAALSTHLVRRLEREQRPVVLVGPRIARMLADATDERGQLALAARIQTEIVTAIEAGIGDQLPQRAGVEAVALAIDQRARDALLTVVRAEHPEAVVVSTEELAAAERRGATLAPAATVDVGR